MAPWGAYANAGWRLGLQARRRRLLVEQQAAREAAERKAASDNLLELLAKRSGEEQKLAQRLWQLGQEREVMKANRALREQRYAERRERDWEETLQREAALHRCGLAVWPVLHHWDPCSMLCYPSQLLRSL